MLSVGCSAYGNSMKRTDRWCGMARQADKKFVLLSAEVERISQQNSELVALVAELSKMKGPSYSHISETIALRPSSAAALSAQITSERKSGASGASGTSGTSGRRDREQDNVRNTNPWGKSDVSLCRWIGGLMNW